MINWSGNCPVSLGLNYPEFPDTLTFWQFPVIKNAIDVFRNITDIFIKQLAHLLLGKPHRLLLKVNLKLGLAVFGLVDDNAAFINVCFSGHR